MAPIASVGGDSGDPCAGDAGSDPVLVCLLAAAASAPGPLPKPPGGGGISLGADWEEQKDGLRDRGVEEKDGLRDLVDGDPDTGDPGPESEPRRPRAERERSSSADILAEDITPLISSCAQLSLIIARFSFRS